ncbi:hypothetical protein [Kribbella shirazensis]|uniref:Uncharacterized protein n=1 Tax=Kribbella shirazensis TaxID=1105143 RepID=A0A7X5VG73_9ACTN|nr:hypothetical protein [Kribbella shirazensis]NIK59573.1 hypothetical protein [Kribbella shirazensis]
MKMLSVAVLFVSSLIQLSVLIVGLVLTGRTRRTGGDSASKGLIGCAVLLLNLLITVGSSFAAPVMYRASGVSQLEVFYAVRGLLSAVLLSVGIGFLIAGVLANGRSAAPGSSPLYRYPAQP